MICFVKLSGFPKFFTIVSIQKIQTYNFFFWNFVEI